MEKHYFIACTLSDEAKSKLHTIRASLLSGDTFKKIPALDDLHITLSFLGAVSEEQLNIVCDALDKKIKECRAFPLTFNHIHTFGPEDSPRVWWAGPEESEALTFLYQTVQEAVSKIHKDERRPFRPHVTLAKKWKGEPASVYKGLIEPVTDLIKQVTVYEIHPGETPMYKTYHSMKLIESGENNGTAD